MATFYKTVRKHLFLHPVDKKRRHAAVKATLLRDRKKYSDRLEGALLDVANLKVVGDRHLVVDGYLSMEVVADVQVFSPRPGMELDGVINKRSTNHLGCLVMDTFNAALATPSNSDLEPQVGDLCSFVVSEVVVDGEVLFMRGMLARVLPCAKSADQIVKQPSSERAEASHSGDDSAMSEQDTRNTMEITSQGLYSAGEEMSGAGAPQDTHKRGRKHEKTRSTSTDCSSGNTKKRKSSGSNDSVSTDALDKPLHALDSPTSSKRRKTDGRKLMGSSGAISKDEPSLSHSANSSHKRKKRNKSKEDHISRTGMMEKLSTVTSPRKGSDKHKETDKLGSFQDESENVIDTLISVTKSPNVKNNNKSEIGQTVADARNSVSSSTTSMDTAIKSEKLHGRKRKSSGGLQ